MWDRKSSSTVCKHTRQHLNSTTTASVWTSALIANRSDLFLYHYKAFEKLFLSCKSHWGPHALWICKHLRPTIWKASWNIYIQCVLFRKHSVNDCDFGVHVVKHNFLHLDHNSPIFKVSMNCCLLKRCPFSVSIINISTLSKLKRRVISKGRAC